MKRMDVKRILSGVLCAALLCSLLPAGLTAAAADTYRGSDFTTNAYIASRVDVVLSEFPPGSYFTYSGDPCGHHDSGTCSYFGGCNCISTYYDPEKGGEPVQLRAVQCLAFERYFFYKMFGFIDMGENESLTYSLGSIPAGGMTAENVKALVSQAKTGAHVRAGSYHSMMFLSCDEEGFWMYHGNTDFCCKVNIRYLTWGEFASKYQSEGITEVILPLDYPGEDGTIDPTPIGYAPGTYTVSDPTGLYLREGPGTSYTKLRDVPYGTVMNVTEIDGVWGKTVYDGLSGWVNLDYAACTSSYQTGTYRVADAAGLNLREGPGTGYTRLLTIPDGTELTVTAIDGGWGRTGYNGQEGWISLEYTAFVAPTPPPSELPVVPAQPGWYRLGPDGAALRVGPLDDSEVLLTVPAAAEVEVTAVDGAWGEASYAGVTGWMRLAGASYLSPALSDLQLQSPPDKTVYTQNGVFDPAGLTLLARFADGSEQTVTEGYTLSYDFSAAGPATVAVTFRGRTVAVPVTVEEAKSGAPGSGDIDGNGSVNSSDARLALQFTVELIALTDRQQLAGDVNGDERVDSSDARTILMRTVG